LSVCKRFVSELPVVGRQKPSANGFRLLTLDRMKAVVVLKKRLRSSDRRQSVFATVRRSAQDRCLAPVLISASTAGARLSVSIREFRFRSGGSCDFNVINPGEYRLLAEIGPSPVFRNFGSGCKRLFNGGLFPSRVIVINVLDSRAIGNEFRDSFLPDGASSQTTAKFTVTHGHDLKAKTPAGCRNVGFFMASGTDTWPVSE